MAADLENGLRFIEPDEDNLIMLVISNASSSDTVAVQPQELRIIGDLIEYTGCYMVYVEHSRERILGVYEKIPSVDERIKDLEILYGDSSLEMKLEVLEKYDITMVIRGEDEVLYGEQMFSEVRQVSYLGREFYLCRVAR